MIKKIFVLSILMTSLIATFGVSFPVYADAIRQNCNSGQVSTGVGCIPTDASGLAQAIYSIVLGVAGGLAVLFIIIGGFKVATSSGDPDKLQEGRETITAAIAGLVFLLLAVSILAIIGIDILGLSAFSRSGTGINVNP